MKWSEWQSLVKPPEEIIVNASRMDGSDAWQPFPIGMSWQFADLLSFPAAAARTNTVLVAVSTHTDARRRGRAPVNRRTIVDALRQRGGYENRTLSSSEYFAALPTYKFVVSPEGNGVDCHRHYEALLAGCIPIVERHPGIEEKYRGCPILYTDDYREINDAYLAHVYDDMSNAEFDFSRLFLSSYSAAQQTEIKKCSDFWIRTMQARPPATPGTERRRMPMVFS